MKQKSNTAKGNIISGMAWVFGERISAQLVSMLITIVLARLLDPEHYGVISIVTVFITLLDVFVTSGFGTALVQKKEADKPDFDTAFILSFGLSVILYIGLFACAPMIADFYEMPELTSVLRVMGLRLPLAAFNNIQHAYIQRSMEFKRFFLATIAGTVVSGVMGVVFAALGFGVWALVVQYLLNTAVGTIMLSFVCKWKPGLHFSIDRAKRIWSFGWKVLVTQLVATLESDIRSLIVGKVFGSADLAFFDQGKKYPALLVTNINSSIDKVMLPAYSKEQENREKLLSMLRKSVRIGVYVLTPILLGFMIVSESFVVVMITEKWLPCVPFLQIFCISFLTRPIESSCRQALLAIGKSGTVLVTMIFINAAALSGVLIAVFLMESVFAIAVFSLVSTFVSLGCFLIFTNYHLGYKLKMQMQDFLPSLVIGLVMLSVVWLVGLLPINKLLLLILQIFAGAGVYIGLSAVFKLESFNYLLGTILKNKRYVKK